MNIIIHGTKGGYRVLHSTPGSPLMAGDSRSATSSESVIGQATYSIAFAAKGCVFTKIVIVRDLIRNMATGNIAFSVYLPGNEKLLGADIKSLLDKLSNHYCKNYAPDNNLGNIHEDWAFVEKIKNEFTFSAGDGEEFEAGTADAAFIYYTTDDELQKYFNAPYQEEYSAYKQIFFVKSDLKDKLENPLNALRHNPTANLTEEIDLDDLYYYLNNYNRTKGVIIKANGKERYGNKGNNCIRAKWLVEITYSKNDRYYIPITAIGKLSDSSSDIHKYLEINGKHIKIKYEAFNPKPIEKTINIVGKDFKGNPINDAAISYKNAYEQPKQVLNNQIAFFGEDVKERYTIFAQKGKDFYSDEKTFVPEGNNTVELILHKYKKVALKVTDKGGKTLISNFEIWINDGKGWRNNIAELCFKDADIDKTWQLEIKKQEGQWHYGGKIQYCPAKGENMLYVQLDKTKAKKTEQNRYPLKVGDHGSRTNNTPDFVCSLNDAKKEWIQPNRGYKVKDFILIGNKVVAQYEKKPPLFARPKIIAGVLAAVIVIGLGVWVFKPSKKASDEKEPIVKENVKDSIEKYIKGDSLKLDSLKSYSDKWETEKPSLDNKSKDSPKYKEWASFNTLIDAAKTKRNLVDKLDFAELKKLTYSDQQQKFQIAIGKVDSTLYDEVKTKLGSVDTLALTTIADSIDTVLKNIEQRVKDSQAAQDALTKGLKEGQAAQVKEKIEKNNPTSQPSKTTPRPSAPGANASPTVPEQDSSELEAQANPGDQPEGLISKDIIAYLKGDQLQKSKLEEYKKQVEKSQLKEYKTKTEKQKLQASIDLALKFWTLNGTANNSYSWYAGELKKDKNLKASVLKAFVDEMCKFKKPACVTQLSKTDQRKTLSELAKTIKEKTNE